MNHTFQCFASSSASRHAKGMYWGDGIEGQLLSLRDGSARARIDLSPRTRWEVRQHCSCSHLPAHEDLRETISWTAAMRCPIQRMTGTAIELPRAR